MRPTPTRTTPAARLRLRTAQLAVLLWAGLAAALAPGCGDSGAASAGDGTDDGSTDEPISGATDDGGPDGGDGAAGGAGGEDPGGAGDGADLEPLPELSVHVTASDTEGNAPLSVEFSAEVKVVEGSFEGELDMDRLEYNWAVGDITTYDDPSFTHSFYTATTVTVTLEIVYRTADDRIATATDDQVVQVLGCADLLFDTLTMAQPVEVAPGDPVTFLQARLRNEGDRIETPFEVWVVLSADDIYDAEEDAIVDVRTFEGMEDGQFSDVVVDLSETGFDVPADLEAGNYFVYLVADPAGVINECQESNNVERSTNNLEVDPDIAFKPDLLVEDVAFPEGLEVNQGQNINYSFRIKNEGEGDAEIFKIAVWLSADQELSEDDQVISAPTDLGSTVQTMLVGGSQNFFKSYKIPQDLVPGEYFVIVSVDANEQVAESDEDNNVAVSPYPFTMFFEEPKCFDLELASLEVSPSISYWNGTVQVLATIHNGGTQAVPPGWEVAVYFSLQPSLNPAIATKMDTSDWSLPPLAPGETLIISELVKVKNTLPVQPHYVGLVLDPGTDLTECAEGNNALVFPEPVEIVSSASIELVTDQAAFHPSTVQAGHDIKVTYSMENTGSSPSSAFKVAVVLSVDPSVTLSEVKNGTDVTIHESVIPSINPGDYVDFVEKVVVPVELEHSVGTYTLAVVADPEGSQTSDSNKSNNISIAPVQLTVLDPQGGCFEDVHESNNTMGTAAVLEPGAHVSLGSCGDDDWYRVHVPQGQSLFVDAVIAPILSIEPVPSDLDLSLHTPDGAFIDTSTKVGGLEDLRVFTVPETSDYLIRVYPKTGAVEARYDLDIEVLEAVDGVELLPIDVTPTPPALYPGGLINIGWDDVNLGASASAPYTTRVWASKDGTLDTEQDLLMAQVPAAAVPATSEVSRMVQFLLPPDLDGGEWRFIVSIDTAGLSGDGDASNNEAVSDVVFLDATLTCADDDLEPNDGLVIATPIAFEGTVISMPGQVVCPSLPDWYAVELQQGQSFTATASYVFDSDKGQLELELWDPSGNVVLASDTGNGSSKVRIPWVWSAGTYYLRAATKESGGNESPYTYTLTINRADGAESDHCDPDVFEDNSWVGEAATIGCGLQSATLCKADIDVYVIELFAGQTLTVTLEHGQSELRMDLLTDPNGVPVSSKVGNGQVAHFAADDQQLWLRVQAKGDAANLQSFAYSLFMDGVDGVDLIVPDVSLLLDAVYQGEDDLIEYSVENTCVNDSAPFETTVWLSKDEQLDEGDVDVAVWSIGGVPGKETVDVSHKVSVPFSTQPGDYWLLVEADSAGLVEESNEDNNYSPVGLAVAKLCLPDAFEPNDILLSGDAVAPLVEAPGAMGLALCPFDIDWYRVDVPSGKTVTVTAVFSTEEGDLDLRLYDPQYSTTLPVEVSQTPDDDETVSYTPPAGGEVLLRLNGFNGASAAYDLEVVFN